MGGYTEWRLPGGGSYWIETADPGDEQPGSRDETPTNLLLYLEVGLDSDDADTIRLKLINAQMVLDSAHLQYELLRTNTGTGYALAISYQDLEQLHRINGITDSILAVYGGRTSATNTTTGSK